MEEVFNLIPVSPSFSQAILNLKKQKLQKILNAKNTSVGTEKQVWKEIKKVSVILDENTSQNKNEKPSGLSVKETCLIVESV